MATKPIRDVTIKVTSGNFKLPINHEPGMRVPKGGSSCSSCKYVSEDKLRCDNKYFTKWHGTDVLPEPADEYCSDWYEPNEE